MAFKDQFRSVIEWDNPLPFELFFKFSERGDEIKNASKLVLQPGQGCILTYEGKIQEVFTEEGLYNLETDNVPFITTLKKVMNFFESEHKVGVWFYRVADMVNIRWGTRIPITYNDPVYGFPVNLRGFGNYSLRITDPTNFFTNIIAGQEHYCTSDLQEVFLSRITQPITSYLANAKFSYADIDSNIETIAADARERTEEIFQNLGFELLDFRIEGTSFDEETDKRIGEISDVQAEAKAASFAGVDFAELQRLKAMRDAAKNEGNAGAAMGMFTGMGMGAMVQQPAETAVEAPPVDIRSKLQDLKALFEDDLISQDEYDAKKQELISQM